jgi:hypothetical protein
MLGDSDYFMFKTWVRSSGVHHRMTVDDDSVLCNSKT